MPLAEPSEIPEIEAQLALQPDSHRLRERLLEALVEEALGTSSPSRIATILWFISHYPGDAFCRSQFVAISPEADPTAFATVKAAWLDQVDRTPGDTQALRGAAFLISAASRADARQLLTRAAAQSPDDPDMAIELGRIADTALDRFGHFMRARQLGSTHQNLPVWVALAATQAHATEARPLAQELLDAAGEDEARVGAARSWQETGEDLWQRARRASENDADARALTQAITRFCYYKHWGHTVFGLLALENGDMAAALSHLELSKDIQHDFRLNAYGPAPHLLRALCQQGQFEAVQSFLVAWLAFSENDRARGWLTLVERRIIPGDDAPG